jgi:predicted phage-related endonuclease
MPISREQLSRRRNLIGSSDSPAIVGVNPPGWTNAADVYLEKTLEVAELPASQAIEIGDDFEEPLLRWAARELGVEILPNVELVARHAPVPMGANLDALVLRGNEAMEAKTGTGADYGAPETDQVPERVLVQVQHQCYVAELDLVWVPVLIARFDRLERVMYKVKRNEDLIRAIVDRDAAFWQGHVVPRIPPAGLLPSLEVLRRVRRVPDKLVAVSPELVEAWRLARAERKQAEEAEEAAEKELVLMLGDGDGADYGDRKKILSYRGYSRETLDTKALRAQRPEVWEAFKKVLDVAPGLREVNR